jgi:hypothetical protein
LIPSLAAPSLRQPLSWYMETWSGLLRIILPRMMWHSWVSVRFGAISGRLGVLNRIRLLLGII